MRLRRGWEDAEQLLNWFCRIVFSSKHFLPTQCFVQASSSVEQELTLNGLWTVPMDTKKMGNPIPPLKRPTAPPPPYLPRKKSRLAKSQCICPQSSKSVFMNTVKRVDSFPHFFVLNLNTGFALFEWSGILILPDTPIFLTILYSISIINAGRFKIK